MWHNSVHWTQFPGLGCRMSGSVITRGSQWTCSSSPPASRTRCLHSTMAAAEDDTLSDCSNASLWHTTLHQMVQSNGPVNLTACGRILEQCDSFTNGNQVHNFIVQQGLERSPFIGSRLVYMYVKWGMLDDAVVVFENMHDRIIFAWNSLIQAYPECGGGEKAIELFGHMLQQGVMPNKVTYLSIVYACDIETVGKRIHACIAHSAYDYNVKIRTALLNMYGKCGSLSDARRVFDDTLLQNAFTWTAIIVILIEHGQGKEAIQLFDQMLENRIMPDIVTFVSILSVCAKHAALEEGQAIHARVRTSGLESDVTVQNALMSMYGKCDNLEDARTVFDRMSSSRTVVSWTSMIALYAQKGYCTAGLILFEHMQSEGMLPNKITYLNIFSACAGRAVLAEGKCFHSRIVNSDLESDPAIGSALINMYGKCGSVVDARRVFDKMEKQDLVLWNTMITVYAQNRQGRGAIELFEQMQEKGFCLDKFTFVGVLAACTACAEQAAGELMHNFILESGLELEIVVANALIHMYGQCGKLSHAKRMFDNLIDRDSISWTVMIAGYASNGLTKEALKLFDQMQQQGLLPDEVTFVIALDAYTTGASRADCQQMHARVMRNESVADITVQNAVINMYGKCGYLQNAQEMFDAILIQDLISWNALMTAYMQNGYGSKALDLFKQMLGSNMTPDKVTFSVILSACASQVLMPEGKQIHSWVLENGCDSNEIVGTALISMYGKCGSIKEARWTFDKILEASVFAWNAMIATYAQCGLGQEAIQVFNKMQVRPDALSFLVVLAACSHTGLVDEGRRFFASMTQQYDILPCADHYACMIDLLSRAGQLDEAENMIHSMPCQATTVPFAAMLGACRSKHDMERGERVAKCAFELNLESSAIYILLSNIRAAISREETVTKKSHRIGVSDISSLGGG